METQVAKREKDSIAIEEMALKIARESPTLADLCPEQLRSVARAVVMNNLIGDLKRRSDLAGINYTAERYLFIKTAGRTRSKHTRRAYKAAMNRLGEWAKKRGLTVLEIKPRDADDFTTDMSAENRAPASVRRDVAAASSFFTWLERRHDTIRNPFRGSKARPALEAKKQPEIPFDYELPIIYEELPKNIRAAAMVMASRGLRVGALPGLSLRDGRFSTTSKGKKISGELPPEALAAVKGMGAKPFNKWTALQIANAFRYTTGKLKSAGKLDAAYSVHDLRHYYAVRQYRTDKDIYQLKRLLGHASIGVTERYLKSIGELEN